MLDTKLQIADLPPKHPCLISILLTGAPINEDGPPYLFNLDQLQLE
jgi:hypothetical protein